MYKRVQIIIVALLLLLSGCATVALPLPYDIDPEHNLPYAKYPVDSDAVPISLYEYSLPLTTSSEAVFSYWCPDAISDSATFYAAEAYTSMLSDLTGVTLEYVVPAPQSDTDDFSVLLASDDLPDLLAGAIALFPSLQAAVEDSLIVNLFDYKDLMPCYYYTLNKKVTADVKALLLPYPDSIFAFRNLENEALILRNGLIRGDYLDRLGVNNSDIVTLTQLHNVLTRIKTELDVASPFLLYASLDPDDLFNCFDTRPIISELPTPIIINGDKVTFSNSRQEDLNFISVMSQWWREGLIYPDWTAVINNSTVLTDIREGNIAYIAAGPEEISGFEAPYASEPDARWVPLRKPLLFESQVLHCGGQVAGIADGSWIISASCEDIPLLVSYCDWFYSSEGSLYSNYGVEDYTFFFNHNSEPQLSDFILYHEYGINKALSAIAMNELVEGGLINRMRAYKFPGGERFIAIHYFWSDPLYYQYDASMQWPQGITFSVEQNAMRREYAAALFSYIKDALPLFIDGSKPLNEWNNYVAGLYQFHFNDCVAIYQQAYDAYRSTND